MQNITLFAHISLLVHRLAIGGYIRNQQKWLHMDMKMEKVFNLYHTQMLPRGKKITNKIIKERKEHKNNSLCTVNSI